MSAGSAWCELVTGIWMVNQLFLSLQVSLVQMTKLLCLVSHIFFSFNVQVFVHKCFQKVDSLPARPSS